jgi:hypothetical protein
VAFHVLEIMHGFLAAAEGRKEVAIHSRPAQPRPLNAIPLPSKSPTTELAHD